VIGRWGRAAATVQLPSRSRVLDLGCAFGFGTHMLIPHYAAFGHDLDAGYITSARASYPQATFTVGPASRVPYPDAYFDAVLLLDVLEHVQDERAVVGEILRVLRPGGRLIISVPNRGALAAWDSLNLYHALTGGKRLPPTDDPSWSASPRHRHYSIDQLLDLLGPSFALRSATYTGVGVAEPVNLVLLLLLRAILPAPRLYALAQYLYFGVYLIEDRIPANHRGYHLMAVLDHLPSHR
jgi:SAM-dependent methyltransferase